MVVTCGAVGKMLQAVMKELSRPGKLEPWEGVPLLSGTLPQDGVGGSGDVFLEPNYLTDHQRTPRLRTLLSKPISSEPNYVFMLV